MPTATFQMFVVALVHSQLDYGNAVLVGISDYLVHRLQLVLNMATRLIYHLRPHHRYVGYTALAAHPRTFAVQNRCDDVQGAACYDIWDLLSQSPNYPVVELCGQQVPSTWLCRPANCLRMHFIYSSLTSVSSTSDL